MTVREALDEKRKQLEGKVKSLVLCKLELFYFPSPGNSPDDTVYPVTLKTAQEEAAYFGVELTQQ